MFRVAILASTEASCNELCSSVESSALGGVVQRSCDLLRSEPESVLRKIAKATADVAVVEIPSDDSPAGIAAIRHLHANLDNLAIFAVSELSPQVIVSAMQSGACEFLDRQPVRPPCWKLSAAWFLKGARADSGLVAKYWPC